MKNEKQQTVIEAAMKTFAQEGYQYVTVEQTAKETGVAKGLVHIYFEKKLDLLLRKCSG